MITTQDQTIAIFGQGYVGLPLALALARSGFKVIGIDNNPEIIELLRASISPIEDVSNSDLESMMASKNYLPTDSIHECAQATIKIICVPTPLDESKRPDLKALVSATTSVAKVLQEGDLVIVESTVAPFTTKKIILPILLEISQISQSNFDLAYSPERIDPANRNWSITTTPKVVAGINLKSRIRAETFYSKFVRDVVVCDTIEIAETAKLLENTFRLINISFINELSVFFS